MTQYINTLDEQNRFKELRVYNNNKTGQINSHGFSYLQARKIIAKGKPIGLELLIKNQTFKYK